MSEAWNFVARGEGAVLTFFHPQGRADFGISLGEQCPWLEEDGGRLESRALSCFSNASPFPH